MLSLLLALQVLAGGDSPGFPPAEKGGFEVLPPYAVDVTHRDGLHQHDEQQRESGCVVVEDVEPVIASLHGEDQADDAVDETDGPCECKTWSRGGMSVCCWWLKAGAISTGFCQGAAFSEEKGHFFFLLGKIRVCVTVLLFLRPGQPQHIVPTASGHPQPRLFLLGIQPTRLVRWDE